MNMPQAPLNTVQFPLTTVQAPQLQAWLANTQQHTVVLDCSFDLGNPAWGLEQFTQSHVAGAQYAHLDDDLSAKRPGQERINAGRHPLPMREAFAAWLASRGITPQTQVVVYDRNAQQFCVRLWWMCQWAGHRNCAVLDGGLAAWQALGAPIESGPPAAATPAAPYLLSSHSAPWLSTQQVADALGHGSQTIVDARAAPRYRGEVEPLDPVAGHIPGALNRPFALNFDAEGKFKPASVLRQEFEALLQGRDPASVVHHCGSGVTATPNVLAMLIAGYGMPKLYPGSWSEWCNTPGLPVATGA